MHTKMRFRTDGFWFDPEVKDDRPAPEPGDTWAIHWHGGGDGLIRGPLAGYAICCPKCRAIHHWTTANNCSSLKPGSASCGHSGSGSCWQWSGSAEGNALTASPSLHASGSCGWHGWLKNGILDG